MPKKPPDRPTDRQGRPLLKMRELVEATGVSAPTILFYVNRGLLPQPSRPRPNVAHYPFDFVERIHFIKRLQTHHRLSLDRIGKLLRQRDQGKEVAPLIEMHEEVFGPEDTASMGADAFSRATGLTPKDIAAAEKADLIIPKQGGRYDTEDLAIGRALRKVIDLGLSLEDAAYYSGLAEAIVDREMAVQERLTRGRPFEEQLAVTLELTRIARSMRAYVIDRIFQRRARVQADGGHPIPNRKEGKEKRNGTG